MSIGLCYLGFALILTVKWGRGEEKWLKQDSVFLSHTRTQGRALLYVAPVLMVQDRICITGSRMEGGTATKG